MNITMTIVFINGIRYDLSKILQRESENELTLTEMKKLLLVILLFRYYCSIQTFKKKNDILHLLSLYYFYQLTMVITFLKVFD
jgi:hypothetical protein